jgi:hypothetical protein
MLTSEDVSQSDVFLTDLLQKAEQMNYDFDPN